MSGALGFIVVTHLIAELIQNKDRLWTSCDRAQESIFCRYRWSGLNKCSHTPDFISLTSNEDSWNIVLPCTVYLWPAQDAVGSLTLWPICLPVKVFQSHDQWCVTLLLAVRWKLLFKIELQEFIFIPAVPYIYSNVFSFYVSLSINKQSTLKPTSQFHAKRTVGFLAS